jgi:hypothetical protein
MLWYKSWLETRYRVLSTLCMLAIFLAFLYSVGSKAQPPGGKPLLGVTIFATSFAGMTSFMLAGAGIATQSAFQATKGLHGSTLFTLALPVSRLRLLVVRTWLGWLGSAAALGTMCCGIWAVFPVLRATTSPGDMLEYAGVLIVCSSALHLLGVLMATFLDDQWRTFGSMGGFAALWWLSANTSLPASMNIFRAMGEASPLLTHTMPWHAMAFSLALATVLFFAALKIVQRREY